MKSALLALCCLALSAPALADTRDSNKDKTSMERGRSPSTQGKQQEEHTEAHSQPDSPHPGGTTPRNTTKSKAKPKAKAGKKESSSTGASRPLLDEQGEIAFRKQDLDGDGEISKAEAAGSDLINAFERFDRNKNGKLSRAEYARAIAPKRQAASR